MNMQSVYYVREAQAARWTPTRAHSLPAAKRADALNMRVSGRWIGVDPMNAPCGDIELVEG